MQLILFIWFIFYNCTCFGRSPRPSSGVICLQTVVAATGVCYRYGVDNSRIGVRVVKNKPNKQSKLHLVGIFIKLLLLRCTVPRT